MASNAQTIWNKLKSAGFTDIGVAALMGNMTHESGLIPQRVQGDFSSGYNTSIEYTNNVNNKTISEHDFVRNGPSGGGYGLCQWTYYTRKQELYDWTVKKGISVGSLDGQLNFCIGELLGTTSYNDCKSVGTYLKSATDLYAATVEVLTKYEMPNDQGDSSRQKRYNSAKEFLSQFSSSSTGGNNTVSESGSKKYSAQLSAPQAGNKFYITRADGGYSSCIRGNYPKDAGESRTGYPGLTALPNCVGYACGRFNELIGSWKYDINGHATTAVDRAKSYGLSVGTVPQVGAMICWGYTSGGYGHVGIVETVTNTGGIVISQSGWSNGKVFWTSSYEKDEWTKLSGKVFKGFIYNPAIGGPTSSVEVSTSNYNSGGATSPNQANDIRYKTVQQTVKTSNIITADAEANTLRTKSTSLLTTPTLVESPFIILKVGNYTFGSYSIDGSFEKKNSAVKVTFPNYMTDIKITKINGQVNQYVITMVYQIENGNDPNLLDKVFSSVGYGIVYINYGDWRTPEFAYKNEEAIITKLNTNVDFANSRIIYTLYCTSNALTLIGGYHNFLPEASAKPSDVIYRMLYAEDSKYHLLDVFTAFKNNEALFRKCVASDDVSVELVAKPGMDALSYLNYLVSCMSPTTTPKESAIRDANYYLTIQDDRELGTYFTVKKVSSHDDTISLNNTDIYEVDVGYPGDTLVTSFKINNDSSWSLLYDYSNNISMNDYIYNIDSSGNIYGRYSPNVTTSSVYLKTTETQKNWWTQMTQFPITATLTIKGLLRPAMLMSYVRINALFYGQRHVSSGLYIITKQVDTINAGGYRTTLSLTRIAGDLDIISTGTKQISRQVPEYIPIESSEKSVKERLQEYHDKDYTIYDRHHGTSVSGNTKEKKKRVHR